jgi:hypothetical protein
MTVTDKPTNSPQDDEWEGLDEEDLEGPAPRRRMGLLTAALAVLVVGGGAFWAGVLVQKHHDHSLVNTSSVGAAAAARTGRTGTGATNSGAGGGLGGATVGQVKLVDGSTIYVTDASGNVLTVSTTGASTYTKQNPATLKDIQPGDTVAIRGIAQSDGSLSAATVTDSGAGGAAAFGGRVRGTGGGAGTGAATGTAGSGAAGSGAAGGGG